MPLRSWKCSECGTLFRTKVSHPEHCSKVAEEVISPPRTVFMEKMDPDANKSRMVNQEKILRERARKHSRDVELDDLILNNDKETAFQNQWLKADGTKRKKLDDK